MLVVWVTGYGRLLRNREKCFFIVVIIIIIVKGLCPMGGFVDLSHVSI